MVTATEISKLTGVPKHAIYRMAERGEIPAEVTSPEWRKTRVFRFKPSEVEAALRALRDSRPPYSP